MPRLTKAQKLQAENEKHALAFFERTLQEVPDPRRPQGVRYPLRTVVVTALMAMVCGCNDAEAMEIWGETNAEWLARFLEMPHGPPTQDVYLSIFGRMDPDAFSAVFRAWAQLLTLRINPHDKHIAVDGKTSRRSFDTAKEKPAIHTVSAWLSSHGLVLGQKKTGEKSNEIKAIPELLRVLDIKGATVTIDAMGCQTEIAETVINGGADYILGAKNNQPTLFQEIEDTFREVDDLRQRACDEVQRPEVEVITEIDKDHGRVERRTIRVCRDLTLITTAHRWSKLAFVAEVTRERTMLSTQKTSVETSYYIGSNQQQNKNVGLISKTIRRHWSIENGLHWVLDMAFREDDARHRARNTAQNLSTLRHFALDIIKQDKTRKVGVETSRRRAGWDRSYLIKLLTNA